MRNDAHRGLASVRSGIGTRARLFISIGDDGGRVIAAAAVQELAKSCGQPSTVNGVRVGNGAEPVMNKGFRGGRICLAGQDLMSRHTQPGKLPHLAPRRSPGQPPRPCTPDRPAV